MPRDPSFRPPPPPGLVILGRPEGRTLREVQGPSGKIYRSTAIFCLLPAHEPRRSAIRVVESRWFDPLILLTILCNCATMAWESPLDPCCTPKAHLIEKLEWVFLAIFTTELLTKVLAYGFLMHQEAYLRDAWCQLDFVVVTLAWLPILIPTMGNYSVLRAFRALRPLRALKRVPGMPMLVQWILTVLPKMGNVLMLCGFVFLVFGIVGMELFKGSLHYRCARTGFIETAGHPGIEPDGGDEGRRMLAALGRLLKGGGNVKVAGSASGQDAFDTEIMCSPDAAAVAGGGSSPSASSPCPAGTSCAYFDENPSHGLVSFDSVGLVFVAFMQSITFDDWATPMYALMASFSPLVWTYFVAIVMIGGFFIVNLFLAVIFLEFGNAQAQVKADAALTARRGSTQATARTSREEGGGAPGRGGEGAGETSSETVSLLPDGAIRSDRDGSQPAVAAPTAPRCDDCSTSGAWRRPFAIASDAETPLGGFLSNVSTALVLVNMVLMCMPYEGMSEEYAERLEGAASVITWIFIVEMAIKLVGLGCEGYWSDGWNKLDGTIVTMSIVEMLMTALVAGGGVNVSFLRILRMLRMLRVLRMLRLMRKWRGLYKIVTTLIGALPQMANLSFLILLTMFMFSLLGMQLFGGIYRPETGYSLEPCPAPGGCEGGLEPKPHYHFDYCYPAMISIFVLLTGEWVDATEPAAAILGPLCTLFFIVVVVIGKYLLLNLLVAVILTEFQEPDEAPTTARLEMDTSRTTARGGMTTRRSADDDDDDHEHGQAGGGSATAEGAVGVIAPPSWPRDHSLYTFGPHSCLRRLCRAAIRKPQFDQVVICAIIISSLCLALDSPRLDPHSDLAALLKRGDLFFTLLFFCEMSTKIIAFGFACNGPDSYLRNPWNQIDFVIVCISLLVLLADSVPQLRPLRVLRVMRVLRPLRLISRNAGMKLIITSLFRALPAVSNVFGVVLTMQLVFAILGMQLYSGTFASCNNPAILTREECAEVPTFAPHNRQLGGQLTSATLASAVTLAAPPGMDNESHTHTHLHSRSLKGGGGATWDGSQPLRWSNPTTGSFDNFADAMRLLYIMSSGDQWEIPMYAMMAATGPGHAPVRNDFSASAIFAICWMFTGYIFTINLFVGVVVDNFSKIQKESDGSATMTTEQKQWSNTMRAFAEALPTKALRPPSNPLRRVLFKLISSSAFDAFITGVIIANIGVMACDYWGIEQDVAVQHAYDRAMDVFSCIYYVECVLKLIALSPAVYFSDAWCRFDFFLVCTSLIDQFASELLEKFLPVPPMLLRVLRILRILRILRLLKGAKELRDLIVTMVLSFPSLINVGSLLGLVIFIYAVLGVNMFTFLSHGGANGINDERNFDTMGNAFLTLLQCLTGDGWSTIMGDAMKTEEGGFCSDANGDCGTLAAIPYFISFQILGSFIFLNLVVAVILENFATLYFVSPELVSTSDLEVFSEAWAEFDPDATNYVPLVKLPDLLLLVPRPLGVKGKSHQSAVRLCLRLRVPQRNGRVAFHEVLKELIENNFFRSGADLDEEAFREMPESAVPPLALGGGTVPPPSSQSLPLAEDSGMEAAAAEQELIAEVFAMQSMFKDDVRDAFIRSLKRARTPRFQEHMGATV